MSRPVRTLPLAAMLWLALHAGAAVGAPLKVVASIKPIHSLVAGVMQGVGEPVLLVEGGASPHAYALRPSEARALQQANAVFWVGADLETFLAKPLDTLAHDARVVALSGADGIALLPIRASGVWNTSQENGKSGHADHGRDMHIWLDPANAKAMAAAIADTLAELDPANGDRYRANAAILLARIDEMDAALARDLSPVRERRYIVFHDAFHYFENHFGLAPAGSLALDPERQPGARRVGEIRRKIVEAGVVCVFDEPQFEPALIDTAIAGTGARKATLDPLGADLASGPDAYFALMRGLSASLTGCLRPPPG